MESVDTAIAQEVIEELVETEAEDEEKVVEEEMVDFDME